jgi:hypothetical protein
MAQHGIDWNLYLAGELALSRVGIAVAPAVLALLVGLLVEIDA